MEPAIALLELDSIAAGIDAGDAMAKRAPIDGPAGRHGPPREVSRPRGGPVGDVEESLAAGREVAAGYVLDVLFLPDVHPDVVAAIGGRRREARGEALGVIETRTVAAIIDAADAGLKGARVQLLELRLADDLGGKGYLLFDGPVSEVEAAVEIGSSADCRVAGRGAARDRPAPHGDGREPRRRPALSARVRGVGSGSDGPQAGVAGETAEAGPQTGLAPRRRRGRRPCSSPA